MSHRLSAYWARLPAVLTFCLGVAGTVPELAAQSTLTPDITEALGRFTGGHDYASAAERARDQAKLFANNDAVNAARLNGEISDAAYQAAQSDFDKLNTKFGQRAAHSAGADFTVQQRPAGAKFSPGTDSDYITVVKDKSQIGKMQTDYNRRVNRFLKENGVSDTPRSNWHNTLDTDFMADPSHVTEAEFREIAKMNNDAYKRRASAEFERISRAGGGKIGPEHAAAYVEDMTDFTAKKQKLLAEMLKDPSNFNNSAKRAKLFQLMAQEQKYISRIEALDDYLRAQERLPPRNRGITAAKQGSIRDPSNAKAIKSGHKLAKGSQGSAIADLAETMGEAAKNNPDFARTSADDLARILARAPAEHRAAAMARLGRANPGLAKAVKTSPHFGAVDDLAGVRTAPGMSSTADDIAEATLRQRIAATGAKAMVVLGKLAAGLDVYTAASQLDEYYEALSKAMDPSLTDEAANAAFARAAEIANTLFNTGVIAVMTEMNPAFAAALGTWVVSHNGVGWVLENTETGRKVIRIGGKLVDWDAMADLWVREGQGLGAVIAANQAALCTKIKQAIAEGRMVPVKNYTADEICYHMAQSGPEGIADMYERGEGRTAATPAKTAAAEKRKCPPAEAVRRGPDKDGFVPVTEDPDAGSGYCAPAGEAQDGTEGDDGAVSVNANCEREIRGLQLKINNSGARSGVIDERQDRALRKERAWRSTWQSEECGLSANVSNDICRKALREIESATAYVRELQNEYDDLRTSKLQAAKQLAAKMEACRKTAPTWLTESIRRMETEPRIAETEKSDGEKLIESMLDDLLKLRQKAETGEDGEEPGEEPGEDKTAEDEKKRETAQACANAQSYDKTAEAHYRNGDVAAYRSSLAQAKAALGALPDEACGGLSAKIAKGERRADALERVNTAAGKLLAACKGADPHRRAAQLGRLSAQLSEKSHPHLQQLARRLAAAQRAAAAYGKTKDAFKLADFDAADRSLANAQTALGAVDAGDCPDLRAALAKAPKVLSQWRGIAQTVDRLASSCDIADMKRYRAKLTEMKSPVAATLAAQAALALADCDERITCAEGYGKSENQADGKIYCVPTKATADAWCRENNPGAGAYAVDIKPDGTHGCRPSKSALNATCRKANPGMKGIYAKIDADGSYECRQTKKAAAAAAKAAGHKACQRANNDRRARAGKYLGDGNWSCYIPGQKRAVAKQPPRAPQRSVRPPPRRSIPYNNRHIPSVQM